MKLLLFILTLALCLTPWMSPPVALASGIIFALGIGNPVPQQSKRAASLLLKICVVLLGFGMDLTVVLQAGIHGIVFAAISITATLLLGAFMGRMLHIHPKTSALISAGTAICGGSAIAAVGSVINATEAEMTVAIGTVFILNAVALYLFPFIGHVLHLSQTQFGTWAGVAIHDISSVVGAASSYGLGALQTATAVKLSRALWIVPVAFGSAIVFQSRIFGDNEKFKSGEEKKMGIQIPWFIGLFLLASVARSFLPEMNAIASAVSHTATIGFTITLFLIGSGLSKQTLQAVGVRPLLQGIALWIFISVGTLGIILNMLL